MKAMQVVARGENLALQEAEVPKPKPGPGEVLIQVHAAGVTPTELVWYPTAHTTAGEKREHAIPGHEFSGVIAEVGEGVSDLPQVMRYLA